MVDNIIIGSGCAGSTAARLFAEAGQSVQVIELRNHIGGNCFDELDKDGVLIHQYGPHIFHTNVERVYTFLSKYTKWYDYAHEVEAYIEGQYIPVPFNLNSLKIVYGEEKAAVIQEKLLNTYGMDTRVPILKLRENPDPDIVSVADYVYDNVFLKYTMKQWGQKPEEVDQSVTARVPVLISNDNRYFQDKYQGMPLDGYTKMFENILNHPNITVTLNTDARKILNFKEDGIYYQGKKFEGNVIYTGPIDELFECKFGRLPYRTLEFDFEHMNIDSYQPKAVVNYTVSEKFTRITEYKKLTGQKVLGTTIMREYPKQYTGAASEIPYYAILNDENRKLYEKYASELSKYKNMHLLGRLAEYKYYNIDGIVDRAIDVASNLIQR